MNAPRDAGFEEHLVKPSDLDELNHILQWDGFPEVKQLRFSTKFALMDFLRGRCSEQSPSLCAPPNPAVCDNDWPFLTGDEQC